MKVGGRDVARGVAAALALGFLAFVALVQYAPDSVAFSPNNYGWNGLQGVASTYGVSFTDSLASLPSRAVLVVSQPSIGFSRSDVASIENFLLGGGTLLVADKSGVANSLLKGLGSSVTIQSAYTISDQTYNWKGSTVPTALVLTNARSQFPFVANVTGIGLSQPSPLLVSNSKATDLAITSQFSTSNAPGNPRGPFVVMAAQRYGNGTLIVVGDSQLLLNSGWTIADNRALIGNLFANTSVFIDASHWGVSSIAQLKAELGDVYGFISASPWRYFMTLLLVGLALALVPGSESENRPTPFNSRREGVNE